MSAVIQACTPASGMSLPQPTIDDLYCRSFDQIATKLRSALHFLNEYELLMPEGRPLLDSSYEAIRKNRACVESSIYDACIQADALRIIFRGFPVHDQLKVVYDWLFELNYGINLFALAPDFKINIQILLNSVSMGSVLELPAKPNWGLIS